MSLLYVRQDPYGTITPSHVEPIMIYCRYIYCCRSLICRCDILSQHPEMGKKTSCWIHQEVAFTLSQSGQMTAFSRQSSRSCFLCHYDTSFLLNDMFYFARIRWPLPPAPNSQIFPLLRSWSIYLSTVDDVDYLTCLGERLRRIWIVQTQPRKHVRDREDYTGPTRQHELNHTSTISRPDLPCGI